MKVLLTGAFGNIGFSTLQELLRQGHTVCCFEQKNRRTEKKARQVEGKVEVIWGKVLLVGGGPTCRVLYRDYLGCMLDAMGIGMLPEDVFGHNPYCTDWLDTEESEFLLHYQRHSFDEIIQDVVKYNAPPAFIKLMMPLIRPLVRGWILRLSPYGIA